MRKTASALGGAVVMMATVLATAGSASAETMPTPKWMSCAAGTFVTADLTGLRVNAEGHKRVQLNITPCETPVDTETYASVYAVGWYTPGGSAGSWRHKYPATTATEAIVPFWDSTAAICVLQNEKVRLDCMEIRWVRQDDGKLLPVAGARIPLDAPLVNRVANPVPGDWEPPSPGDPGCMTCDDDNPND